MRVGLLCAGAVIGAVLVAAGCSAEPGETVGAVQQGIQGGQLDTTHRFAVGVCSGSPGNCQGVCSGALILPNLVATARHCVSGSPKTIECAKKERFGGPTGSSFHVTTNNTMKTGGSAGWYAVKQVLVPTDDLICGNDIAMLVLDKPVPASDAKPITPGVQQPMWAPDYARGFHAIGYGVTGPDKYDSQTRRILKYVDVACIPEAPTWACPDEVMEYFSPKEFLAGDGPCSGDSGSSAFEVGSFTSDTISFGVLSRGGEERPPGGEPQCTTSIYTRFDAHRDFVLQAAKEASEDWTLYPEPSWTAYMPPPELPSKDKDAGADAGPKPEPAGADFGETCEAASDCVSGLCAEDDDGSMLCSTTCEDGDDDGCPDGYACSDEVCLPAAPPPAAPATIKRTTTGCAAAPQGAASPWGLATIGAAIGLAALRRRPRA